MARARRRRPRVVWLPMQGNDIAQGMELGDNSAAGLSDVLAVPGDGQIYWSTHSITFDYSDSAQAEQGNFQRSLQDLTSGNAYRLRRIVGKIFVGAETTADTGTIGNVDVACGFIINRTDDSGNPLFFGLTGDNTQRSPLGQDAQQDPWIWRRRWVLSPVPSGLVVDASNVLTAANFLQTALEGPYFPQTNAAYGSVQDGPHIDQKTARIIGNQERLMFWIAARRLTNVSDNGTQDTLVSFTLDARIVASLRQNVGNRRNASR